MLHKRPTFLGGRAARPKHRSTSGTKAMKAARDTTPFRPVLSGPAAAVLVALAGAALVALGLLLVGVRESRVSQWMPAAPATSHATTS
jgi:hypothetical protein